MSVNLEDALRYIDSLTPEQLRDLDEAIFNYKAFQLAYRNDPAGFCEDCVDWDRIRDRPTPYQLAALDLLGKNKKHSIRGPRGLGKTAVASIATHWFCLTRDGNDAHNWKLITTAGSSNQLHAFLWPEIRKFAKLLRWAKIGRLPYADNSELLTMTIKLKTGQAIAISPKEPELVEGAHAESIFYLYDEAKSVTDGVFDSSEGAFSGAGKDTNREAFALAISTPGKPAGRFYAIHMKRPGLDDWSTQHVTKADAISAGRMSQEWADKVKRQWGEGSQLYQNHVLGEFATGSTDSVIPLAWLELAHERWMAMKNAGTLPKPVRKFPYEDAVALSSYGRPPRATVAGDDPEILLTAIGADCAYGGDDKITIAERYENIILNLKMLAATKEAMPTVVTANYLMQIHRGRGGVPVVDVVGVGGGVVDQLRQHRFPVVPFSAGSKAERGGKRLTDKTGMLRFADLRSASWWNLRELLDPDSDSGIAIPPDHEVLSIVESESSLTAELLAPTWAVNGETIRVESKDELRKPTRLGRSTDWADAVVQAFALNLVGSFRAPGDLGIS